MKSLMLCAWVAASCLASASLTPTGAFVGGLQETFESFPNYQSGPFYRPDPSPVFGGAASLSGASNVIYQPNAGATFGLGDYGAAVVHGGEKGMGVDANEPVAATFTFTNLLSEFGGYFSHAFLEGENNRIRFSFFDADFALIDSQQVEVIPSSAMTWKGWSSTVGIKAVTIDGFYPVMDDLQANPVPEPFTMALAGAGLALAARRRLRSTA